MTSPVPMPDHGPNPIPPKARFLDLEELGNLADVLDASIASWKEQADRGLRPALFMQMLCAYASEVVEREFAFRATVGLQDELGTE